MTGPDQPEATEPAAGPKLCPQCGARYAIDVVFCPRDGSALGVPGGTRLEGQVISGRYRVLEQLGAGGMGRVYLAEHIKMGRRCAFKVMNQELTTDVEALGRFNREAMNASRILHPNVAAVYDFGESSDGTVYLAMEFVEGEPLSAICRRERVLPWARAVDIASQVADGLGAAHELGIVHRDLKPDNIMVGRSKHGRDVIKIVDFGIAKGVQGTTSRQRVTRTGFIVGTPAYMSPEQLAGDTADARSDLFALGCILYEMLTGASSFAGANVETRIQRRLAGEPLRPRAMNSDVPQWLDAIVAKLMARDPDARFQTAAELRDALATGPHGAAHRRAASGATSFARRIWFTAGAFAATAVLVSLGMNRWHAGHEHEASTPPSPAVGARAAAPSANHGATTGPGVPVTGPSRGAAAAQRLGDSRRTADSLRRADSALLATTPASTAIPNARGDASRGTPARDASAAAPVPPLELLTAQRSALAARQAAADSGASPEDLARGDALMKLADSAIARRRYASAVRAMNDVQRVWVAAGRTAAARVGTRTAAQRSAAAATRDIRPPTTAPEPPAHPDASATSTPVTSTPSTSTPLASAPTAANAAPAEALPAIQAAVTRYARALESRDIGQLRSAYPGLTKDEAEKWQGLFESTNRVAATLTVLGPARISASGTAEVTVAATLDFDYKAGVNGDRHTTVTYHALLTRDGGSWKLTSIE